MAHEGRVSKKIGFPAKNRFSLRVVLLNLPAAYGLRLVALEVEVLCGLPAQFL